MTDTQARQVNMVGPVVRGVDCDIADALIAAIETDNPGVQPVVEDRGGYIRVSMPGRCRVTRHSLEAELGRDFPLSELEPALSAFAGRVKFTDDEVLWYLEGRDET